MTAHEVVLAAARMGVRADTPEEGFAQIRSMSGLALTDAELAEIVAEGVRNRLLLDPVRLLPGCLQCFWKLELAEVPDGRG